MLAEIRATNHVSLTSVPDVTQTTAPLRLWSRAPGVILSRSMQRSAARLTLLASLVVGGMLAASFLWIVERRSDESVATQADISIRLARMSETIAGIGAAPFEFPYRRTQFAGIGHRPLDQRDLKLRGRLPV